ncbi:MAG: site-specific tyrosine recombinase/integron integrase [bacterium]
MNIKKYIIKFLTYLEIEKNRSLATVKNYDFYLSRFAKWAEEHNINDPSKIGLEDVTQYRIWLNRYEDSHGNSLKKNTQNYHLIALRAFLKYLAKIDVKTMAPEKIELAKMPERDVTFLEGRELERFLNAPLDGGRDAINSVSITDGTAGIIALRDKAILETLFSTGLRVSELVSLKIEQVDLKDKSNAQELTVRGKGRKVRIIFLSNQALYWIKKYLEARRDVSPYVFVSHDKAKEGRDETMEPLTTRSVQRIVRKYAKIAGITKKVSPHTLRHSFATNLLTNDADIRAVQIMLGHSSITTTQIYTHITDKHLRETFIKAHKRE